MPTVSARLAQESGLKLTRLTKALCSKSARRSRCLCPKRRHQCHSTSRSGTLSSGLVKLPAGMSTEWPSRSAPSLTRSTRSGCEMSYVAELPRFASRFCRSACAAVPSPRPAATGQNLCQRRRVRATAGTGTGPRDHRNPALAAKSPCCASSRTWQLQRSSIGCSAGPGPARHPTRRARRWFSAVDQHAWIAGTARKARTAPSAPSAPSARTAL